MNNQKIYDIVGIGIGPFNLGLAALAHDIKELSCLFFDQKPGFNWHPGMMIPGTRMQVPYYADLVTLANPQSRFSWFSYLHAKKRMFRFATLEQVYPTRKEYVEYCSWVASQLTTLKFNSRCEEIQYHQKQKYYSVVIYHIGSKKTEVVYARNLVIGIGSVPYLPVTIQDIHNKAVFHSSEYLFRKTALLLCKNITLIGSGQSAAEIFLDLLNHVDLVESLHWFTRPERLMPMDTSVSAMEMSTPAYISYFYNLQAEKKKEILRQQGLLYKGINPDLIRSIFIKLDELNNPCIKIHPGTELRATSPGINLELLHLHSTKTFSHITKSVVLATGYEYRIPTFMKGLEEHILITDDEKYEIDSHYRIKGSNSIFVQNADLHSHGFNAADLSSGPYRNVVILNSILKRQEFNIENGVGFQNF